MDRAADTADVFVAVAPDIVAAAAFIEAAVVDGAVGAVAALNASVADDPVASCNLDHRRDAWLTVCRSGLAHGLHLQPWFGFRRHGQRLLRGLRHSSSLGPTESSPPEQINPPRLTNKNHFPLRINKPHRELGELGRSVFYFWFAGGCCHLFSH